MNKNTKKPIVLAILDGWGEWDIEKGNAIANANLPTIDYLNKNYPKLTLQASGLSVGLPWGAMGNSEVGHNSLGTGQIIFQHLASIDIAINSGTFAQNKKIISAIEYAKENKSTLHILGLVSDGGVHSHINHLSALLSVIKDNGLTDVFLHAIVDGRDVAPKSAKKYIGDALRILKELEIGKIATVSGRYFTMDRNNNWDRIEKAYLAMTKGDGAREKDPISVIDKAYEKGVEIDEAIEPVTIVDEKDNPVGLIKEGDVIINFNFRKDRERQITKAFSLLDFDKFEANRPKVKYYGFSEYEEGLPIEVIFPEQKITARVGEIISKEKKRQLRIAETEKYAHVTFFFNGGYEKPFDGEDHILVPSKDVKTYAELPEMSAYEITDKLLAELDKDKYDFIVVNYANPDMVGHSGDLDACIKGVEVVDECVKKVIDRVLELDGKILMTADHGNAEEMINLTTYEKDTKHSTNPVPCWLIANDYKREEPVDYKFNSEIHGMIVDVPPTILDLFEIKKPKDMIGMSLLKIFKRRM